MSSHSYVPRVRSRLSWLGKKVTVPTILEPMMSVESTKSMDLERIIHAYEVAERLHRGVNRKSGEPYITHPVAVATILAELGLDEDTLVAGLLHDTVEDTPYTVEELSAEFGPTVALLVDGVTKLDKVNYGEAAASETVRKMIIAMAKDIRVLLIKLGDRLHNARTWRFVSQSSAQRKARETLEIFAPLAHRLGMNSIKWELEDLSFRILYPAVYSEIERMVRERAPERERFIEEVKETLKRELAKANVKCTISGRPKHYYSIYQKMILRGRDFEDIYDLVGVRVLVEEVQDCYTALGVANSAYTPIQGRIKDYIASPKFNLYQSIHTTVMGPGGRTVEVQIRTYDMHRRAEYGVAAHWRYKENPNAKGTNQPTSKEDTQLEWLRQLVDWQRDTADPSEFLDSLRYEMSKNKVYVFTPAGEVKELPAGSTPVDFAFAVHTEVGCRTVGAKVNDRLVTLDHELQSGDTVEIITSKSEDAAPSQGWADFVVTARARSKIKQWYSRSRKDETVESGKDKLAKAIRRHNEPIQRLMSHETLKAVAQDLNRNDVSDLYAAIGEGSISAESVVRRLIISQGGRAGAEETMAEAVTPTRIQHRSDGHGNSAVIVASIEDTDVLVKLAKCCTPVPPDEIVGFVTRGKGISVHRADCPNVDSLRREPDRFIDIAWDHGADAVYLVQVQIEALDRRGLLADISRALAEHDVNMISGTINTSSERVAKSSFTFEMADPHHLERVLRELRKIEGVYDAYRVTGNKKDEDRLLRAAETPAPRRNAN
ncbi:RelA/SpoT family protein [Arcanobacterium haemolyticum]|uniref:(P)ppGpp synthetase I, SpoT/RelA n=1 Tax=Arcanobacterium haemolyticum (strain ATCC 9345 / DSM 20595 / CCM 5947 / CCUG 17215 / LMG 16163 / NBRC 15585 / NCTC 8452 / 11018) TaxID=644284 RepID=D7BNQ5_ARCHD|nr:bifunctional (p)ppGpp synthetase/guanosine-3',5'-bis(diphosphate) 3'-pyrophosphohydrolase [Arcanobacterium haemolyticum]ADH92554.1 (p)ppGpp synthetase I, SpoT/RelA [Arcanobacterium haemolyticum DSM 20595]SQH28712.1 Bifunctional (p)ppGpp synthase/hydrolase relA [Arcanobacterium haemolyticum]